MTGRKIRRWKGLGRICLCAAVSAAVAGTMPTGGRTVSAGPEETTVETEKEMKTERADFPGSLQETELEQQIREYLEAVAAGDTKRAKELRGAKDRDRDAREAIMRRHGLSGYEDVKIVIYPLEEDRLIFVSYCMVVEGLDVTLPGLNTWIARKGPEGEWTLLTDSSELSTLVTEQQMSLAKEYIDKKEVYDWMMETNRAFNEIVWDNEDVMAWIQTISDDMDREDCRDGESSGETGSAGSGKNTYIVQKGDCLWNIAKETLEDAMRWAELYTRNKETIGDDPDFLLPDMALELPGR